MDAIVPLGELCEILSGFAWSAAKFNQDRQGIPIIRIQNVDAVADNNFVFWDDQYDQRFVVRKGDILLTLSGSFRIEEWGGPDSLLNQRIIKLTPKLRLDRGWLLHVLRPRMSEIERLGKHALVNNVSVADIRNLKIPLPPLAEQRRIAEVLDRAQALRAKRRAALARLDALIQSIFFDLFGDFRSHRIVPLESLASNKRYALSSGPFGSSLTSKHYVEEGVLVLRGLNVTGGVVTLRDCKFVSENKARELSRSAVTSGDIVIVAVGTSGLACLIPETFPRAVMSQNFNKISPNLSIVDPTYLCFTLNSKFVQRQMVQGITDTVRTFLSLTKLRKIAIPSPPISLQHEFARRVAAVSQLQTAHRASLAELDSLFAVLQHRAFRGEL